MAEARTVVTAAKVSKCGSPNCTVSHLDDARLNGRQGLKALCDGVPGHSGDLQAPGLAVGRAEGLLHRGQELGGRIMLCSTTKDSEVQLDAVAEGRSLVAPGIGSRHHDRSMKQVAENSEAGDIQL